MTAIINEHLVLDADGAMSMVVQHTHYMPKRWRRKEGTEMVRNEFEVLFPYAGMMLLEELASIFLTSYLLLFVVPKVEDIIGFINDFTENVEGVGAVCSFSTFNFAKHGNMRYGSPVNAADKTQRSCQGKIEKSLLSFHCSYPSCELEPQGNYFLQTIKSFIEQKLPGYGDRNKFLSKELPCDGGHPYLLAWYYTSHQQTNANVPSPPSG